MNSSTPISTNLADMLLQLKDTSNDHLAGTITSSYQAQFENSYASDVDSENSDKETCHCRKSKCLKLYCQCFAVKAICSDACRCLQCENSLNFVAQRNEAIRSILERNPAAFDSKFKPVAGETKGKLEAIVDVNSLGHRTGCKCKRSMCLKKYCECYQAAVRCSSSCVCLHCCNTNSKSANETLLANLMAPSFKSEPIRKFNIEPMITTDSVVKAAQDLGFLRADGNTTNASSDSDSPSTEVSVNSQEMQQHKMMLNPLEYILGIGETNNPITSPLATKQTLENASRPPLPVKKSDVSALFFSGEKRKIPHEDILASATKKKFIFSPFKTDNLGNNIRSASPNSISIASVLSQLSTSS